MSMQMAELHYVSPPIYDANAIAERAESLTRSGIELSDDEERNRAILLVHSRHVIEYSDGTMPAQTAILAAETHQDASHYADEIQQSWACEDAQTRLEATSTSTLVTEMVSQGLEPNDRLHLFHGVVQATVELTKPHAIVFRHAQQVVAPEDYLATCGEAPVRRTGSLNVRFFNVSNSDTDDMIMDTRGLDEVGLHDLQCHFRDLDPNDVGRVLYGTALYIADNGPVIEGGHTIEGSTPGSRWRCQYEHSLLEPNRDLLDLDPGPPNAAGSRDR